jgi:hypothetical protein
MCAMTHGVAQREIFKEREEHDERQHQRHNNGRSPKYEADDYGN